MDKIIVWFKYKWWQQGLKHAEIVRYKDDDIDREILYRFFRFKYFCAKKELNRKIKCG